LTKQVIDAYLSCLESPGRQCEDGALDTCAERTLGAGKAPPKGWFTASYRFVPTEFTGAVTEFLI